MRDPRIPAEALDPIQPQRVTTHSYRGLSIYEYTCIQLCAGLMANPTWNQMAEPNIARHARVQAQWLLREIYQDDS